MKINRSCNTVLYNSIIGLLLFCFSNIDMMGQSSDDSLNIIMASLDYIEGWYEGSPQRHKLSLHKKLIKWQVHKEPTTGKTSITKMNKWHLAMILNMSGGGSGVLENDRNISAQILDISVNAASVKVESFEFTDYLHLAYLNDSWIVINILWELKQVNPYGSNYKLNRIFFFIFILIISPLIIWTLWSPILRSKKNGFPGVSHYVATHKPQISRIILILSLLFIWMFINKGGWILFIICLSFLPILFWSNCILWKYRHWRHPGRIYFSMLSLITLFLDFLILLQFNII